MLGLLWDQTFPINKSLWTSSFALLSSGLAAASLAACHWVLDVKRWRGWEASFIAFGRNALVGYTLSVGVDSLLTNWTVSPDTSLKGAIYQHLFAERLAPCCGAEAASLGYALAYVATWGIVLSVMYRKRVFIGI